MRLDAPVPDAGAMSALDRFAAEERFRDRVEAGRELAGLLAGYADRDDVIVLGLPRGGVPVAFEVARALSAPLDVFLVRKLGVPGHEELALGAIASGGIRVVNRQLVDSLDLPPEWIEAIEAKELRELERRERAYRGDRPPPDVTGRTVILVDDGLATGSTMLAAVDGACARTTRRGSSSRCRSPPPRRATRCAPWPTRSSALLTPRPFYAVGAWYEDFSQTTDEEVRALLEPHGAGRRAAARRAAPPDRRGDRLRPAARTRVRAALRPDRRGDARHARVLPRARRDHEAADRRGRLHRRGRRGRLARRLPRQPLRSRRERRRRRDEALADFKRFPAWMWRNTDVAAFVTWLREWNDALPAGAPKVGFYGLDLYSLHASMDAVIAYLDQVDPDAARRARERYACFDHFGRDPQIYGYDAQIRGAEPCEQQAVEELLELQRSAAEVARHDGRVAEDRHFYAEQNARIVVDAERYYRAMFRGGSESWNLRDRHMADTLDALVAHLERTLRPAKAVVWEHNSHVGDARATEMGPGGQVNVGQLARERHGEPRRCSSG